MRIDKRCKIIGLGVLFIVGSLPLFLKTEKPSPFNVILISIDALRADHLGCYGYKLDTSPNIDRFEKEATLFTQAISQGSVTAVALLSLYTSTYPRTHGVYRMGYELNNRIPTLAQILKKNNYATAAIVCCIKYIQGLERGFDVFSDDGDVKADKITQKAISWLEKNRYNKFFLWLHYFDPHGPYRPPSPYNRMFIDNFKLGKRNIPISKEMYYPIMAIPGYVAEDNITDVDYYISQYDGEIRFVDEQIGILLRKIKELDLDKRSILIITADHGELLGEHGIYFCHSTLYDQVLRIPLLVKCEKIIPSSKIVNQQVQAIDIVPTILALLHIPKGRHMQGKSLLPLILGKDSHLAVYAFSENDWFGECIRAEGWKLMNRKRNNHKEYELYSLNSGELDNLIDLEKEKFRFLKSKLDNWYKKTPINEPKECEPIAEEFKQLLKSLGYLQ